MKESNVLDKSNVLDNLEQLYNNIMDCFSKNNDYGYFNICNQILKDLIGQDSSVEIEYVDNSTASSSPLIRKKEARISLSSNKKAILIDQLNDENEYEAILLYLDGKKVIVYDDAVKIINIIKEKKFKFNNLHAFDDDENFFSNDQFKNEVNEEEEGGEGEEENNLQNQQSNSDEENNNKFFSLNNSINKMEIQTSQSKNTHILSNVCGYDLSWLDCCNICDGK